MSIPRSKNGQSGEVPAELGGRADPRARMRNPGAHGLSSRREQRSPQVPAQPSAREGSRDEPITDQPRWDLKPHSSSDPPTKPDIDKSELAAMPRHHEPSASIPVVRGEHAQLMPRRGPGP